jgi:hypothetical protein
MSRPVEAPVAAPIATPVAAPVVAKSVSKPAAKLWDKPITTKPKPVVVEPVTKPVLAAPPIPKAEVLPVAVETPAPVVVAPVVEEPPAPVKKTRAKKSTKGTKKTS